MGERYDGNFKGLNMTKEFFIMHFGLLLKYLGLKPENEKTTMYFEFLKHMDDDTFKTSVQEIIKSFVPTTQNPFPLVSHFMKYTGSDEQGSAIKAISTLKVYIRKVGRMESVNFNDNALHETVERFGGWPAVCNFSEQDWNINENRMIETYKVMATSPRSDVSHLAGLAEKDNGHYRVYDVNPKTMQISGYNRLMRGVLIETTGTAKPLFDKKEAPKLIDSEAQKILDDLMNENLPF
jgi:hypothetical protein